MWNTVAVEYQGDGDLLNNLCIKNDVTGQESDLPVKGLFYAIGAKITHVTIDFPFLIDLQAMDQQPHTFAISYKRILTVTSLRCLVRPRLLCAACLLQATYKTSVIATRSRARGVSPWPHEKSKN